MSTKKKRVLPVASYEAGLVEKLKSSDFAIIYLNTILKSDDIGVQERFLAAFKLLAKAYGISKLSRQTALQRESLRKALSEKGNPRLSTLFALMEAFGFRLKIETAAQCSESIGNVTVQPQDFAKDLQIMKLQLNQLVMNSEEIMRQASSTGSKATVAKTVRATEPGSAEINIETRSSNVH